MVRYVDHRMCTTVCGPPYVEHRMWTTVCGPSYVDHRMWTTVCGPPYVDHSMWTTVCNMLLYKMYQGRDGKGGRLCLIVMLICITTYISHRMYFFQLYMHILDIT